VTKAAGPPSMQARNHRVKLRHASGETYCRLADEGPDADPIHLYPGAAGHWHASGPCQLPTRQRCCFLRSARSMWTCALLAAMQRAA
jgi:hypothetical protein